MAAIGNRSNGSKQRSSSKKNNENLEPISNSLSPPSKKTMPDNTKKSNSPFHSAFADDPGENLLAGVSGKLKSPSKFKWPSPTEVGEVVEKARDAKRVEG
eukprot:1385299-Amorphochlora_amoeboformis.AAC.1